MIKKLLILIMILFFSTTNAQENYNDLWEKVQRLEVENLPKSALKIVDDIYAKAEKTIIEGVTYFDLEQDKRMRSKIKKEKSELINMMMQAKNKGLKTQPIKKKVKEDLHCDSIDNQHTK